LTEIAVNGAIAAKDQDNVGWISIAWHPDAPVDARVALEGFKILCRTSHPENGGGPHMRG
jgi:hypothetical protein